MAKLKKQKSTIGSNLDLSKLGKHFSRSFRNASRITRSKSFELHPTNNNELEEPDEIKNNETSGISSHNETDCLSPLNYLKEKSHNLFSPPFQKARRSLKKKNEVLSKSFSDYDFPVVKEEDCLRANKKSSSCAPEIDNSSENTTCLKNQVPEGGLEENREPAKDFHSIDLLIDSTVSRYHFLSYIYVECPQYARLVQFRIVYKKMKIAVERQNYVEANSLQNELQLDFFEEDGKHSLSSIFPAFTVNSKLDFFSFQSINSLVLEKLEKDVYSPFISSKYHRELLRPLSRSKTRKKAVSGDGVVENLVRFKDNEIHGLLEQRKNEVLGKRSKWRYINARTEGPLLIICLSSKSRSELRKAKTKTLSLIHAKVLSFSDSQRHHCFQIDVSAWSKQGIVSDGCKHIYLSAASYDALSTWKTELQQRIEECTQKFQHKNNQMGRTIFSSCDLIKTIRIAFIKDIESHEGLGTKATNSNHQGSNLKDNQIPVCAKNEPKVNSMIRFDEGTYFLVFLIRCVLFLSGSALFGIYQSSISWIFAIAGLWIYTDEKLGNVIPADNYVFVLATTGVIFLVNYFTILPMTIMATCLSVSCYAIAKKEYDCCRWQVFRSEAQRSRLRKLEDSKKSDEYGYASMDKLDWINLALERSWSTLKETIENSLKDCCKELLSEANLPSFLSRIEICELEFGKVPSITGVFVHNGNSCLSGNSVVADININWHDFPNISFLAVSKAAGVATQLKLVELFLNGTLRIEFLFDQWEGDLPLWPCFSALRYAFTEKPVIDFRIKAMKLDVMNVPLLSDWLDRSINEVIESSFTYPNSVTAPDWRFDGDPSSIAHIPKGVLIIQVLSTEGVIQAEKNTSLFCKLSVDGSRCQKFRTKKVGEGVNAAFYSWNETFFFQIDDEFSQTLFFSIVNGKVIGKDSIFGESKIAVSEIINSKSDEIKIHVVNSKNNGFATLKATWRKVYQENSIRRQYVGKTLRENDKCPGILMVKLIKGVNLCGANIPKGLPFVVFTLNDSSGSTQSNVAKNMISPVWNESFVFVVNCPQTEVLSMEIKSQVASSYNMKQFNIQSDECVGKVKINVSVVQISTNNTWLLPLEVKATGMILLQMIWRPFC